MEHQPGMVNWRHSTMQSDVGDSRFRPPEGPSEVDSTAPSLDSIAAISRLTDGVPQLRSTAFRLAGTVREQLACEHSQPRRCLFHSPIADTRRNASAMRSHDSNGSELSSYPALPASGVASVGVDRSRLALYRREGLLLSGAPIVRPAERLLGRTIEQTPKRALPRASSLEF